MSTPIRAGRRWLLMVVALIAAAGAAQVAAVGAIECEVGVWGAREWLHTSIVNAVDVENEEIAARLRTEARVLLRDSFLASALTVRDDYDAVLAVDAAWPEPDEDDGWLLFRRANGFTVKKGLPCADAVARLQRIEDHGFISCGGVPFLAAHAADGGHDVWAVHRIDESYVDTIGKSVNVDVALIAPSLKVATLHDMAGNRVVPPSIPDDDEAFHTIDVDIPGAYAGYHATTTRGDMFIGRGETRLGMFVETRPLGEGSDATVAMLVATNVLMGKAWMTTAAGAVCAVLTVILLAVVAHRLIRRYTRPLADLERAARAIVSGDVKARAAADGYGEMELLSVAASFNAMVDKLEASRTQLLQKEKLSSIGQLAAGIAHEINTPMQYIQDNTYFIEKSFQKLVDGKGDVSFFKREVPKAIAGAVEGIERVTSIVRAMKDFSHPSKGVLSEVNVRGMLETTAAISKNEWKYVAELSIDVPDDMPALPALKDELSGAILNMIVNAAHAIADARPDGGGHIALAARAVRDGGEDYAEIEIGDDGVGIPADHLSRVFDPFFTTKDAGKGTGQGLAIAWSVVVDKHKGTLAVRSELGRGTTFVMRLPLRARVALPPPAASTSSSSSSSGPQPPRADLTAA